MSNKRKILFVDYIWRAGHVNFNKIHIDALRDAGFEVALVLYGSMKERLPYPDNDYAMVLPAILKMKEGHPLFNRLLFVIVLALIRLRLSVKKYDYVILSNYDELSLGLIPLGHKMLLISHSNAESFTKNLKKKFLHGLACRSTFIVFNKYIASAFLNEGLTNIRIVSHGCLDSLPTKIVDVGIDFSKYAMVVFQASSKIDSYFYKKIFLNRDFCDFLHTNNILFVLRNCNVPTEYSQNIISFNKYLSKEEYDTLMSKSKVILVAYPDNFKYQVSGVSYECVTKKKCMAIYDNPALHYCREYFNYEPIFTDLESFKKLLSMMLYNTNCKCVVSPEQLKPNYSFLNIQK